MNVQTIKIGVTEQMSGILLKVENRKRDQEYFAKYLYRGV